MRCVTVKMRPVLEGFFYKTWKRNSCCWTHRRTLINVTLIPLIECKNFFVLFRKQMWVLNACSLDKRTGRTMWCSSLLTMILGILVLAKEKTAHPSLGAKHQANRDQLNLLKHRFDTSREWNIIFNLTVSTVNFAQGLQWRSYGITSLNFL